MAIQTKDWSQVKERCQSLYALFKQEISFSCHALYSSTLITVALFYCITCKCVRTVCDFQLDPHVKVEGKRTDVMAAKKKILEVLETKVTAVNNVLINAEMRHSIMTTCLIVLFCSKTDITLQT